MKVGRFGKSADRSSEHRIEFPFELFGNWFKFHQEGDPGPSRRDKFIETIFVEYAGSRIWRTIAQLAASRRTNDFVCSPARTAIARKQGLLESTSAFISLVPPWSSHCVYRFRIRSTSPPSARTFAAITRRTDFEIFRSCLRKLVLYSTANPFCSTPCLMLYVYTPCKQSLDFPREPIC